MSKELPKSKNSLGYTEAEVKEILFKGFAKYMTGQTCGITKDNKIVYYQLDVKRYLAGLPTFD